MKIRWKLACLSGLFALSMVVTWTVSRKALSNVQIGSDSYQEIIAGKDLLADVLPPPLFIIEMYLTVHEVEDMTDPEEIRPGVEKIKTLIAGYSDRAEHWRANLPEGPAKRALLDGSDPSAVKFMHLCETEFIPLMLEGRLPDAQRLVRDELEPAYRAHREAIDTVVVHANQFAKDGESHATATLGFWNRVQSGASLAALLVTAAVCWLIGLSILRPLARVTHAMKDIAQGEGDLTKRMAFTSHDEIGDLARWFDLFVTRMHDTIAKVAKAAWTVSDSSQRIASASEEAASNTRSQTAQTEGISSAIEQMTAATSDIARKSGETASIAGEAGTKAREGGAVVESTVEGIRSISGMVKESATMIGRLGQRSEEIGKIVEVINDIADQTNLLALNAAIEAARAGEHGRGFAVVADEVRKLADRTTKATAEIAESIKTIQADTASTVDRFGVTAVKVDEAVALAERSGAVLQEICEGTGRVTGMVESIAAATEEQTAASMTVSDGISTITVSTNETAQGAAEAARAATTLWEESRELTELVGGFRLDVPEGAPSVPKRTNPNPRVHAGTA